MVLWLEYVHIRERDAPQCAVGVHTAKANALVACDAIAEESAAHGWPFSPQPGEIGVCEDRNHLRVIISGTVSPMATDRAEIHLLRPTCCSHKQNPKRTETRPKTDPKADPKADRQLAQLEGFQRIFSSANLPEKARHQELHLQ